MVTQWQAARLKQSQSSRWQDKIDQLEVMINDFDNELMWLHVFEEDEEGMMELLVGQR